MGNLRDDSKLRPIKPTDVVLGADEQGCLVNFPPDNFSGSIPIKIESETGDGEELFTEPSVNDFLFKKIKSNNNSVKVSTDIDDNIDLSVDSIKIASLGAGAKVYKGSTVVNQKTNENFRSLLGSDDIFAIEQENTIALRLNKFAKSIGLVDSILSLKDQDNNILNSQNLNINNINGLQSILDNDIQGIKNVLKIEDPIPEEEGKYELIDIGTYTNLVPIIPFGFSEATTTPITTESQYNNYVYWDGTNFKQIKVLNKEREWSVDDSEILSYITKPDILFSVPNSYIQQTTGNISLGVTGFSSTDFIPISKSFNKLYIASGVYQQFAFYDKNKVYIPNSSSENQEREIDIPSNASYIRLSSDNNEIEKHYIKYVNESQLAEIYRQLLDIDLEALVFDNIKSTSSFSINSVNGNKVVSTPEYSATDYYEIPSNVYAIYLSNTEQSFAFYNLNKQFITSDIPANNSELPLYFIPNSAKFIRATIPPDNNNWFIKFISNKNIELNRIYNVIDKKSLKAQSTYLLPNLYIGSGTGFPVVLDTNTHSISDYVLIPNGTESVSFDIAHRYSQFAFYDINRVYISGGSDIHYMEVPSNAYYIRYTVENVNSQFFNLYFNNKNEDQNIVSYNYNELVLFDNFYVGRDSGLLIPLVGEFSASEFIAIPKGYSNIVYNNVTYTQWAYYDKNRIHISGGDAKNIDTIPFNAKYIKITVKDDDVENGSIQFSNIVDASKLTTIDVSIEDGYNIIQETIDSITSASSVNRYQINVGSGLYKVTNSSQYNNPDYPSFIIPKDHIDIVGTSKEDCIVWAELPYNNVDIDTSIDRNLHQTIYNWADDSTIRNITFVAKNIRYVLHQDSQLEANKTRRYEDCDFIFRGDKGSLRAFGIGTFAGSKTFITGGKSVSHIAAPFAIHNGANQTAQSLWHFRNHEFQNYQTTDVMLIQNSGSLVGDSLIFENCSFSGNVFTYMDWWIHIPNVNEHFNHSEWRITGSGNQPFYFKNEVNGQALCITANTAGQKVRFDESSTAYDILIKNEHKSFGVLGHPEREIINGSYVVQDFDNNFLSFALGGKSIREEDYIFGTTSPNGSLSKRLGNRVASPVTLTVIIGSTIKNILFNQNYTGMTNTDIIALINTQLSGIAVASSYNIGLDYYPELSDVLMISSNLNTTPIPKGKLVKKVLGAITTATSDDNILGLAIDNIQGKTVLNGEVKGVGRIINNCIVNTSQVLVQSGTVITKGKKYHSNSNGELVENPNGSITAIESNLILIK